MYLIHFKSTIKVRGGDAEMNRFAFSICSGSYASTDGNRQKGIGSKGQVGAEHSRLEVFGSHWHQGDHCSLQVDKLRMSAEIGLRKQTKPDIGHSVRQMVGILNKSLKKRKNKRDVLD